MQENKKQILIAFAYAFAVWAVCGAIIAVGRKFVSLQMILITHAIAVPLFAALTAAFYFKKFNYFSPLKTALIFSGFILALDAGLVAPVFEKSFAMFKSFLGTWLPLSLIFVFVYLSGMFIRGRDGAPSVIKNSRELKFLLAPFGVAVGIAVFIFMSDLIVETLGIADLKMALPFIPRNILKVAGIALILIWPPVFISGFYFLGRRGAVGQSDTLRKNGIYRYVRNPMYSGMSFSIVGMGLILNKTGVVLAGIIWFFLAFVQCKREEKELKARFKDDYVNYKSRTPMFVPNIKLMMKDFFVGKRRD